MSLEPRECKYRKNQKVITYTNLDEDHLSSFIGNTLTLVAYEDYQTTIPDLIMNGTRVMIYAGDVDFICNWMGNKAWTLALEWSGKDAFNAAQDADWNSGAGAYRFSLNPTQSMALRNPFYSF